MAQNNLKIAPFLLLLSTCLVACGTSENSSETSASSETISSLSSSLLSEEASSDISSEVPSIVSSEMSSSDASETPSSEIIPAVTVEEYLDTLKGSAFQDKISTEEEMGLSDVKNVGINQERFEHENLYYDEEITGTVYLAEDYGITPTGLNNAGNLSILLSNIKNVSGNKIVRFKGEVYPFSAKVDVLGISDLYLIGQEGTEFLYSGWGTYFDARLSDRIHIFNIDFDMKYSPTIAGPIVKFVDHATNPVVTIQVDEEFDLTQSMYQNWPGITGSYMETYYDDSTGRYVPDINKNLVYNSPSSASYKGITAINYRHNARELDITINKNFPYSTYHQPSLGTMVSFAFTMYENHGFYFLDCNDVYMENVNVFVTGGMGFRVDRGSNFYLNRLNYMIKENSKRIMTCTADIIHTACLEGDLMITNSTLEASHDDALNIKSFYGRISAVVPAAKEITIVQTQTEVTVLFEVGDVVDIYSPTTMALVDSYTIVELTKSGTGYTVVVDRRPSRDIVDYNIGNASKATALTLDNTLIQHKRNRGILLQGRNSKIINCTFRNVVMGAIQVLAVADQFREAIVPQNIQIENTKFINNVADIRVFAYGSEGSSASVPNTIKNVEINNNYFFNGQGVPTYILAGGNVKVQHNLYHYSHVFQTRIIEVRRSQSVLVDNNVAYYSTGNPAGVEMLYSADTTDITSTNNMVKGAAL